MDPYKFIMRGLLLVTFLVTTLADDCGPCTCTYIDVVTANCAARDLTSIPDALPTNTSHIDFSRNRLAPENIHGLCGYALVSVNLSGNHLTSLLSHQFDGCYITGQVDFKENIFENITESSLTGLRNVQSVLNLESQYFHPLALTTLVDVRELSVVLHQRAISNQLFKTLNRVHTLSIDIRNAFQIPEDLFRPMSTSLKKLTLITNSLPFVGEAILQDCSLLVTFELLTRHLHSIPSTLFNSTRALTRVCMTGVGSLPRHVFEHLNKLTRLEIHGVEDMPSDEFTGLSALKLLDLSDSSVSKIQYEWFKDLRSLEMLDLANVGLKTLTSDDFIGLSSITKLDLSGNQLRKLDKFTFKRVSETIQYIDLSKNSMKTISDGTFADLTQLKTLDLSSNELHSISGYALTSLKELKELNLHDNKIYLFPEGVFDKNSKLEVLELSSNVISGLQLNVFDSLQSLRVLNISDNLLGSLTRLQNSLNPFIKKVDLSFNHLKCECVSEELMQLLEKIEVIGTCWFNPAREQTDFKTYIKSSICMPKPSTHPPPSSPTTLVSLLKVSTSPTTLMSLVKESLPTMGNKMFHLNKSKQLIEVTKPTSVSGTLMEHFVKKTTVCLTCMVTETVTRTNNTGGKYMIASGTSQSDLGINSSRVEYRPYKTENHFVTAYDASSYTPTTFCPTCPSPETVTIANKTDGKHLIASATSQSDLGINSSRVEYRPYKTENHFVTAYDASLNTPTTLCPTCPSPETVTKANKTVGKYLIASASSQSDYNLEIDGSRSKYRPYKTDNHFVTAYRASLNAPKLLLTSETSMHDVMNSLNMTITDASSTSNIMSTTSAKSYVQIAGISPSTTITGTTMSINSAVLIASTTPTLGTISIMPSIIGTPHINVSLSTMSASTVHPHTGLRSITPVNPSFPTNSNHVLTYSPKDKLSNLGTQSMMATTGKLYTNSTRPISLYSTIETLFASGTKNTTSTNNTPTTASVPSTPSDIDTLSITNKTVPSLNFILPIVGGTTSTLPVTPSMSASIGTLSTTTTNVMSLLTSFTLIGSRTDTGIPSATTGTISTTPVITSPAMIYIMPTLLNSVKTRTSTDILSTTTISGAHPSGISYLTTSMYLIDGPLSAPVSSSFSSTDAVAYTGYPYSISALQDISTPIIMSVNGTSQSPGTLQGAGTPVSETPSLSPITGILHSPDILHTTDTPSVTNNPPITSNLGTSQFPSTSTSADLLPLTTSITGDSQLTGSPSTMDITSVIGTMSTITIPGTAKSSDTRPTTSTSQARGILSNVLDNRAIKPTEAEQFASVSQKTSTRSIVDLLPATPVIGYQPSTGIAASIGIPQSSGKSSNKMLSGHKTTDTFTSINDTTYKETQALNVWAPCIDSTTTNPSRTPSENVENLPEIDLNNLGEHPDLSETAIDIDEAETSFYSYIYVGVAGTITVVIGCILALVFRSVRKAQRGRAYAVSKHKTIDKSLIGSPIDEYSVDKIDALRLELSIQIDTIGSDDKGHDVTNQISEVMV